MEYDEWIDGLFNRRQRNQFELEWEEDWVSKVDSLSSSEILGLIAKTFTKAGEYLRRFPDTQIALGLKYVTTEGGGDLRKIYDVGVTTSERLAVINSIYILFRDCLAFRCSDCSEETGDDLDTYAYMFWDAGSSCIYSIVHSKIDDKEELIEAILNVLEKTLTIPNAMCQQAAIHGLGHAKMSIKSNIRGKNRTNWLERIDEMLCRYCLSTTDEPLKVYAYQARTGAIQ